MDYYVKGEELSVLVEQTKNDTRDKIINQYIALARTNIVRIERKANVPTIEVLTKLAMALDMELEIKFVEKK